MAVLHSALFLAALACPLPAGDGWLGIILAEASARPTVAEVIPDSPAERAGLRPGDVVLAVDGDPVAGVEPFVRAIQERHAGEEIELRIRRDGEVHEVRAILGTRPGAPTDAETPPAPAPRRGEANRAGAPARPGAAAPAPAPPFATDLEAALAEARRRDRPALLVFGASWCPSCTALERALRDPSLAGELDRHVVVWVDTDRQGEVADRHGVQEIPHLVLQDPRGQRLGTLTGFHPADALRRFLRQEAAATADRPAADPEAGAPLGRLRGDVRELRREVRELSELLRRLARERGR